MLLILTTTAAAPELAYALGDPIEKGRRLWLSHSTDVRAAKAAAALAGDNQAIILNINSFSLGLLAGVAACLLWITVFRVAHDYGQALYIKEHGLSHHHQNPAEAIASSE